MTTRQARIVADYEFSQDNPEEFLGYDGRVAQTKILRTVAALNPEATRKEFLEVMVGLGVNRNTGAIQFNQSRKLSVSMGDVSLMADGSLIEV